MGAARVGAIAAETLVTTTQPRARVGAIAAETLVTTTQPRVQVGQIMAEVLVEPNAAGPVTAFIGWGIPL